MDKTNELWQKIFVSYDSMRKAQVKLFSNFNLTAPQFNVLELLFSRGPMPLKKISQELLVTGANITCVVDNLEKENLVKRVNSQKDRRIINAILTEDGKQKMDELYPQFVSVLSKMTGRLSDDEKKQVLLLLDKLNFQNGTQ